jgi:hypothetical protein
VLKAACNDPRAATSQANPISFMQYVGSIRGSISYRDIRTFCVLKAEGRPAPSSRCLPKLGLSQNRLRLNLQDLGLKTVGVRCHDPSEDAVVMSSTYALEEIWTNILHSSKLRN